MRYKPGVLNAHHPDHALSASSNMLKNKCAKKDHLQRAEKKFAQLWEAIGFLEPERNAATIRSFNEQKEAFEVLLDWKREHGESK